jgi:cell division protease FtsH
MTAKRQNSNPDAVAELLERSRYRGDPVSMDDVVGHAGAKRELSVVAEQLRRHGAAERLGLTLVKGIALMGEPGVGKSMLAKALASIISRPAYILPSAEMTPALIRGVYERLALEPCVIVWDEADVVLGDGGRLAAAFCAALDGVQPIAGPVTVALTTADESYLDPSAMRAGRLTTHVTLQPPDTADRRELWARALARVPVAGEVDLDRLAAESRHRTGADIAATVQVALGLGLVEGIDAVSDDLLGEALGRDHRVVEPPEPPALPEDQWVEAVHEAGHACATALYLGPDAVESVALGLSGGATRAAQGALARPTPALVRRLARISIAGRVAEEQVLGRDAATLGHAEDLTRATRLLLRLVAQQGGSEAIGPLDATLRDPLPTSAFLAERAWAEARGEANAALAEVRADLAPLGPAISRFARILHDAPGRRLEGEALRVALESSGAAGARGEHRAQGSSAREGAATVPLAGR